MGFRAGFQGVQKRQRIAAASRFGKQTDFQCAQRIRSAPCHLIIVAHRITSSQPPSGSSAAAVDVESERYAECPGDDLAPGDADERIVEVQVEHRWRKVELRRRVMSHEFRPDRLQIGREDRWPKIGSFPQCKDFQSHDACPTPSLNSNLYAAEPAHVRGATSGISADREVRRVGFRYGGHGASAPLPTLLVRLLRHRRMRPAEIGCGRILADLDDAAADGAGAGEVLEQRFAVVAADGAGEF